MPSKGKPKAKPSENTVSHVDYASLVANTVGHSSPEVAEYIEVTQNGSSPWAGDWKNTCAPKSQAAGKGKQIGKGKGKGKGKI